MPIFTEYLRQELPAGIDKANRAGVEAVLLSPDEARRIVQRTKELFVQADHLHYLHWWWQWFLPLAMKRGAEPGYPYFHDYLNMSSASWLIIDDDSHDFPVIRTTVDGAERVLGELPYVEFYLVAENFEWLLAENHHGMIWHLSKSSF